MLEFGPAFPAGRRAPSTGSPLTMPGPSYELSNHGGVNCRMPALAGQELLHRATSHVA
jgi:hypothetical protein